MISREHIVGQRVSEMKPAYYPEDDPKFCLSELMAVDAKNPEASTDVVDLLDGRALEADDNRRECNIGGCSLRMVLGTEGVWVKEEAGKCLAETYCLKTEFIAVKEGTVEEGRARYKKIISNQDGFYNGNRCPDLGCGLTAGISEDGIPGMDGTCAKGN